MALHTSSAIVGSLGFPTCYILCIRELTKSQGKRGVLRMEGKMLHPTGGHFPLTALYVLVYGEGCPGFWNSLR